MGKEELIYGIDNGAEVTFEKIDKDGKVTEDGKRTFWAPRLEITSDDHGRGVWLKFMPVDENGTVQKDRIQYIELSRHATNRAIRGLRRHRDRVFGKDE